MRKPENVSTSLLTLYNDFSDNRCFYSWHKIIQYGNRTGQRCIACSFTHTIYGKM